MNLAFNEIDEIQGLAKLKNLNTIDLRGNPVYSKEIKLKERKAQVKLLDAKDLVEYCQINDSLN